MATQPANPPVRIEWVDTARGIAICLVVLGHSWRGLFNAGLLADQDAFHRLDDIIYAFHMPVFFLLSGLFFHRSLSRGFGENLGRNAFRLLYPLVIWTYIFTGMMLAAGGATNAQMGWSEFLSPPLPPKLHFWFLWAMFILTSLLQLLHHVLPKRVCDSDGLWVGLLVVTAGSAVWWPYIPGLQAWLFGAVQNAPYFALGILLARWPYRPAQGPLAVFLAALTLGATAWFLPVLSIGAFADQLIAVVMSLAVLTLAQNAPPASRWSQWLAHAGRNSLAIYLCHTIFGAPVRIALTRIGVHDVTVHLVLGVGMGIFASLAFITIARRLGISAALGLGR